MVTPIARKFCAGKCLVVRDPISLVGREYHALVIPICVSLKIVFLLSFVFLLKFRFFIRQPLLLVARTTGRCTVNGLSCRVPMGERSRVKCLSTSLGFVTTRLGSSSSCRGGVMTGMSRSFHSPLASVENCMRTVTSKAVPPRLRRGCLGVVLFRARQLASLAASLLALGRFSAGRLLLGGASFSVRRVVGRATRSFRNIYARGRVSVGLFLLSRRVSMVTSQHGVRRILCGLLSGTVGFDRGSSSVAMRMAAGGSGIFISMGSRKVKVSEGRVGGV